MLQAATLAEGSDVFLLNMGELVRIKALAEQMVPPEELWPQIDALEAVGKSC